jgi:drug/metabolite transporter (DMT)-like permease
MRMHTGTSKALAALIFTIVLWGIAPVFIRGVSVALGPADAFVIRLVASGLIFTVIAFFTTGFAISRKDVPHLLFITFIGLFGYYAGTIFGFAYAPAGIGSLIMSSQPILIGLIAWAVGSERITLATVLGLAIALAGSVLLVWGDDLGISAAQKSDLLIGVGLILIASITWAIYVVFSRSLSEKLGAIKVTCLSNMLIALPMLPFLRKDMIAKVAAMPTEAMTGLALLLTVGSLSVITWNFAAPKLKPSLLGMSLYMIPVIGVFAGWLILGEVITPQIIFAAALILLGVAVSQLKTFSRKPAKVNA